MHEFTNSTNFDSVNVNTDSTVVQSLPENPLRPHSVGTSVLGTYVALLVEAGDSPI